MWSGGRSYRVKQGGGLTWRSQVGANPIPIPHPTNLALFGHKITLYRFNQGSSYYCRGAQMGAGGWTPLAPLTLTTDYRWPLCAINHQYSVPFLVRDATAVFCVRPSVAFLCCVKVGKHYHLSPKQLHGFCFPAPDVVMKFWWHQITGATCIWIQVRSGCWSRL